jgi:carbonic anhydrase
MEQSYTKLLLNNKEWSYNQLKTDPSYFNRLLNVRTPQFLFIGCSDSRVHPDSITGTTPGEIFIHRNLANLVVHTDINLLSVLQYSVDILEVKHIIVCGHYGCGAVKAALSHVSIGPLIDSWLRNIKDVYRFNRTELENYFDQEKQLNRLCELSVIEQVKNLAKTPLIQKAWKERNAPQIHGWIYDLKDGIINPLIDIFPHEIVDSSIYKYDV